MNEPNSIFRAPNKWLLLLAASLALTAACSPADEAKEPKDSKDSKESAAHNAVMAERASQALKAVFKLPHPSSRAAYKMLMAERFEEFEILSKQYEEKFAQDPLYESAWVKLYHAIDGSEEELAAKLDKWIEQRPNAIAYAARGKYKADRGYFFRGSKFIYETPRENLEKMVRLHDEARPDLLRAIEENPKLLPAYRALLDIEQAAGNADEAADIESEAVEHSPGAYYLRHEYLDSLKPRWGGSYKKMQAYVDRLDASAELNPRIWTLKGEIAADKGDVAWGEKEYAKAIAHYTDALYYGDRTAFLKSRGSLYALTGQLDLARADYLRFLEYDTKDEAIKKRIEALDKQK